MTFPLNSIWQIERDVENSSPEPIFEIKIIESHGPEFKGKYINSNDDSLFYGEIRTKDNNNIISIKQSQPKTNYFAFHIGIEVATALIRYVGNWISIDGKKGNFRLVRTSEIK